MHPSTCRLYTQHLFICTLTHTATVHTHTHTHVRTHTGCTHNTDTVTYAARQTHTLARFTQEEQKADWKTFSLYWSLNSTWRGEKTVGVRDAWTKWQPLPTHQPHNTTEWLSEWVSFERTTTLTLGWNISHPSHIHHHYLQPAQFIQLPSQLEGLSSKKEQEVGVSSPATKAQASLCAPPLSGVQPSSDENILNKFLRSTMHRRTVTLNWIQYPRKCITWCWKVKPHNNAMADTFFRKATLGMGYSLKAKQSTASFLCKIGCCNWRGKKHAQQQQTNKQKTKKEKKKHGVLFIPCTIFLQRNQIVRLSFRFKYECVISSDVLMLMQ